MHREEKLRLSLVVADDAIVDGVTVSFSLFFPYRAENEEEEEEEEEEGKTDSKRRFCPLLFFLLLLLCCCCCCDPNDDCNGNISASDDVNARTPPHR